MLVSSNDLGHFVELIPCTRANSPVVNEGLLEWYKRFGLAFYHVSDQVSHFKNEVIADVIDLRLPMSLKQMKLWKE